MAGEATDDAAPCRETQSGAHGELSGSGEVAAGTAVELHVREGRQCPVGARCNGPREGDLRVTHTRNAFVEAKFTSALVGKQQAVPGLVIPCPVREPPETVPAVDQPVEGAAAVMQPGQIDVQRKIPAEPESQRQIDTLRFAIELEALAAPALAQRMAGPVKPRGQRDATGVDPTGVTQYGNAEAREQRRNIASGHRCVEGLLRRCRRRDAGADDRHQQPSAVR